MTDDRRHQESEKVVCDSADNRTPAHTCTHTSKEKKDRQHMRRKNNDKRKLK